MPQPEYLSAKEAAESLGISLATLYAYVSRGLIRSEALGQSRARRYRRQDVEQLKQKKELRDDPTKATEGALNWGMPLLESGLSLIDQGRLYYRGHEVTTLAAERSLEEVASLLWVGHFEAPLAPLPTGVPSERYRAMAKELVGATPLDRMQVLLPVVAMEDASAYDLRPGAVALTGGRILRVLAMALTASDDPARPVIEQLLSAWRPQHPRAGFLLKAALVLAADHEFNVSAFTARCVASAGSTPYAAVGAGLGALQGAKHGGHCGRVEALFDETGSPERARDVLAARLRRGEGTPGFGHPLYPHGDPRGRALRDWLVDACPESEDLELALAIQAVALELLGDHPTIDFALVTLARLLRLPEGAALALFALGRTIGWIGHAIEQYQLDRIIRPRARYVGPLAEQTHTF